MRARPTCRKGIEVPVKIERLLKDEQAAKVFFENARSQLQRCTETAMNVENAVYPTSDQLKESVK